MSRSCGILIFICTVGGLGAFFFNHAAAQAISVAVRPYGLTLTYPRTLGTHVAVEASTELQSWLAVPTLDATLDQTDEIETIQSYISTGEATQLYFRLVVSAAWRPILAWDPSADPDVVGYRLRYRKEGDVDEREIDVGNSTVAVVPLPRDGQPYNCVVNSYNAAGVESNPSNEVRVQMEVLSD